MCLNNINPANRKFSTGVLMDASGKFSKYSSIYVNTQKLLWKMA